MLRIDPTLPDDDGFTIRGGDDQLVITARHDIGLLYGAYEVLRLQATDRRINDETQKPFFKLRLLNHWDNLDGSIERGYAGNSIFEWFHLNEQLIRDYARANASIGINGSVLNNVNASPKMLTKEYLREVKKIADILRPYGIRVFLSINFATPMALGYTKTADPKDASVARWWKSKAREIYKLVPDFGGFLVKANSEGQPGPGDYHRSHADGANMLAEALEPFGGIVMWRCFVYGANHKGEDRVKQAVSEFKPLDGQFHHNVILQTKNGPLDFQPREPYSPIFDPRDTQYGGVTDYPRVSRSFEAPGLSRPHVEGVLPVCGAPVVVGCCRSSQYRKGHQLVRSSFRTGQLVCLRSSGLGSVAHLRGYCP